MPVYTIVLKWMFPKVIDYNGVIIKETIGVPRQVIIVKACDSLEKAKDVGRNLWKNHYKGKEKKLVILEYLGERLPKWDTVFEHSNVKS